MIFSKFLLRLQWSGWVLWPTRGPFGEISRLCTNLHKRLKMIKTESETKSKIIQTLQISNFQSESKLANYFDLNLLALIYLKFIIEQSSWFNSWSIFHDSSKFKQTSPILNTIAYVYIFVNNYVSDDFACHVLNSPFLVCNYFNVEITFGCQHIDLNFGLTMLVIVRRSWIVTLPCTSTNGGWWRVESLPCDNKNIKKLDYVGPFIYFNV